MFKGLKNLLFKTPSDPPSERVRVCVVRESQNRGSDEKSKGKKCDKKSEKVSPTKSTSSINKVPVISKSCAASPSSSLKNVKSAIKSQKTEEKCATPVSPKGSITGRNVKIVRDPKQCDRASSPSKEKLPSETKALSSLTNKPTRPPLPVHQRSPSAQSFRLPSLATSHHKENDKPLNVTSNPNPPALPKRTALKTPLEIKSHEVEHINVITCNPVRSTMTSLNASGLSTPCSQYGPPSGPAPKNPEAPSSQELANALLKEEKMRLERDLQKQLNSHSKEMESLNKRFKALENEHTLNKLTKVNAQDPAVRSYYDAHFGPLANIPKTELEASNIETKEFVNKMKGLSTPKAYRSRSNSLQWDQEKDVLNPNDFQMVVNNSQSRALTLALSENKGSQDWCRKAKMEKERLKYHTNIDRAIHMSRLKHIQDIRERNLVSCPDMTTEDPPPLFSILAPNHLVKYESEGRRKEINQLKKQLSQDYDKKLNPSSTAEAWYDYFTDINHLVDRHSMNESETEDIFLSRMSQEMKKTYNSFKLANLSEPLPAMHKFIRIYAHSNSGDQARTKFYNLQFNEKNFESQWAFLCSYAYQANAGQPDDIIQFAIKEKVVQYLPTEYRSKIIKEERRRKALSNNKTPVHRLIGEDLKNFIIALISEKDFHRAKPTKQQVSLCTEQQDLEETTEDQEALETDQETICAVSNQNKPKLKLTLSTKNDEAVATQAAVAVAGETPMDPISSSLGAHLKDLQAIMQIAQTFSKPQSNNGNKQNNQNPNKNNGNNQQHQNQAFVPYHQRNKQHNQQGQGQNYVPYHQRNQPNQPEARNQHNIPYKDLEWIQIHINDEANVAACDRGMRANYSGTSIPDVINGHLQRYREYKGNAPPIKAEDVNQKPKVNKYGQGYLLNTPELPEQVFKRKTSKHTYFTNEVLSYFLEYCFKCGHIDCNPISKFCPYANLPDSFAPCCFCRRALHLTKDCKFHGTDENNAKHISQ